MPQEMVDYPDILGTLNKRQKQDFAIRLEEMIFEAEQFRGPGWEGQQEFFWRLYRGILPERTVDWPWKGAAAYFIPVIPTAIDTFASLQQDAMFNKTPRIVGEGFQDEETARLIGKFIFSFVFEKQVPWQPLVTDFDLDNNVTGTSAVKLWWDNSKFLTRSVDVTNPGKIKSVKVGEVLGETIMTETQEAPQLGEISLLQYADQLRVKTADLSSIYVSPATEASLDWPECPWYFEKRQLSWEECWANRWDPETKTGWRGVDDDLKESMSEEERSPKDDAQDMKDQISLDRRPVIQQVVFYMRHVLPATYSYSDGDTVEQRWGQEDGCEEECIVWYFPQTKTIADIQPLSRHRRDNKRPHVSRRFSRVGGRFYGIGLAERLAHIQKFVNTTFNQMVDYGTLTLMPWFFFSPVLTGGIPELAGIAPGQGVPVQDPRGVQIHNFRNQDAQFLNRIQAIIPWMERASRVTDHAAGRNSQSANVPRTARGMMALQEQTSKQFSQHSALQAEGYKEMLRRAVNLIRSNTRPDDMLQFQFLEKQPGEVPTLQKMMVPPDLFRGDVDFDIQISPNEINEQQTAQNFFQLVSSLPMFQQAPEALLDVARDLAVSLGKADNFDSLVAKVRQAQEIQLQQQQAAGGQAPGSPAPQPGPAGVAPGVNGNPQVPA